MKYLGCFILIFGIPVIAIATAPVFNEVTDPRRLNYSYPNCLEILVSSEDILINNKSDLAFLASHKYMGRLKSPDEIVFFMFCKSYLSLMSAQKSLTSDQLDLVGTGCLIDGINHQTCNEQLAKASKILKSFNVTIPQVNTVAGPAEEH